MVNLILIDLNKWPYSLFVYIVRHVYGYEWYGKLIWEDAFLGLLPLPRWLTALCAYLHCNIYTVTFRCYSN